MQVKLKNLPRLKLSDLLRRRKMTLQQFLTESGIQAYAALVIRCEAMGVQSPTEEEYRVVHPRLISSPQDGVVVLEPTPVAVLTEIIEESDEIPSYDQAGQRRRKKRKDESKDES